MISRAALFDELVKIGEAQDLKTKAKNDPTLGRPLRAMLVGAGGLAIGGAAFQALRGHTPFFNNITPENLRRAKVILPILGGTSAMLADRYRSLMDEKYKGVRGYGDRNKK